MVVGVGIVTGIKVLVSEALAEKVKGHIGNLFDRTLYALFGEKDWDTPKVQFLKLMDDSLRRFCREYLTDRKFEYDAKAYTRISVTAALDAKTDKKILTAILADMLGEESYNLLNEEDIENWFDAVRWELAQDKYGVLFRYFQQHSDNEQQLDTETVLKIVRTLNKSDGTIEDILCDWFSEHWLCSQNVVDNNVFEIGYILTDYLEKRKNYEKSVEIAYQLLKAYDTDASVEMADKDYIYKMIGCAYSLTIANVTPKDKKKRLLDAAGFYFDKAKKLCEDYENVRENRFEDVKFLLGLYYNDYGALLVNKGNLCKSEGDLEKAASFYSAAEEAHKSSLDNRQALREALKTSDLYDKQDVDNMIARTISSIGGVYFRLERYKDSIEMQKKALETFKRQGDVIRQFRTQELIVGNYICLWERDNNQIPRSEFEMCMNYMKSARIYYEITNNKSLEGVMKKISILEKMELNVK